MGGPAQDPETAATAPRGIVRAVLAALAAVVAFVFTLCACSNDPGALYCDPGQCASDDAGATPRATPSEEPPWLPALPDEDVRAECEACAREKCAAERDNCLDDDACTAVLLCRSICDNPACLERCDIEHGDSDWYADHRQCVFSACREACKPGENWDCVGEYAFLEGPAARFEVTLDMQPTGADPARGEGASLQGAEVLACNPSWDCGRSGTTWEVSRATIGPYGLARLELRTRLFRGFLRVTGGPTDVRMLLHGPPISGPRRIPVDVVGTRGFAGIPLAAELPAVNLAFRQEDCLLEPAPGVRFTLDGQEIADMRYADAAGLPSPGPTSMTGSALAYLALGDEPGRNVVVEGRLAATDRVVSRRTIILAADAVSLAAVLPLE